MAETGVVHGRFQPFHLDHLKYVLAAKEKCRSLVIGITNPDPSLTKADAADLYRSSSEANPLTYFERYSIIRAVLSDAGVDQAEFSIVPFPVNFPELYRFYVPLDAVFYLTIYDDWGKRKLNLFQSSGLRVEVLWEKPAALKGIEAKEVRKLMANGGPWEQLVPPAAVAVINAMGIAARLSQKPENR
jgi:nicotinamide-nucleotide adenylyltransferase